ncbi:MAG: hypothetical protein WC879_03460 [Melioribacteraceae bacterium]
MNKQVIISNTKLCVQDLCTHKTNRIHFRINPVLNNLIDETVREKGLDSTTDFFTKLSLWYFIKSGKIIGNIEKKDLTWHGSIEDMPLIL